jgi:NAD(P)-dependent dehydrogenase (short-subunit alcohol dehydrogenase family)
MNFLKDKIAIVTGGASGIGRALCTLLSGHGAIVVVADINAAGAHLVAAEISEKGGVGSGSEVDVSKEPQVRELVSETVARHGQVDYIFNNAGIELNGELHEVGIHHWHKALQVNLNGVIYGTTSAYPVMIEQGFGHIVNTASLAGLVPSPGLSLYAATKHAVVGFSTSLRAEALAFGVKVSVACPALVSTSIRETTAMMTGKVSADQAEIPLLSRMKPDVCASEILHGVRKNKAIIVIPRYAGFIWFVYRTFPSGSDAIISPLFMRLYRSLTKASSQG